MVPLCIDSKNAKGENDPDKIIDFVKMCQHSFGAVKRDFTAALKTADEAEPGFGL